ncbi:MAG: CBS domain-containing protein [Desulfobacterales bacterium]|nr:CBS domain-containing protein [Desulfobacterales bacterium]
MEANTVEHLMVPLSEYATVSMEATLYDAILALEKAQKEYDPSRYHHRAILVYDQHNHIIGKVSQLDIIMSLEPKYQSVGATTPLSRFGFSNSFLKSIMGQFSLWEEPLSEFCKKAAQVKVKNAMHTPSEGEYVDKNAPITEAIHQLVIGHHQSLLVTSGKDIVGILRLTDVFLEICQAMKSNKQ